MEEFSLYHVCGQSLMSHQRVHFLSKQMARSVYGRNGEQGVQMRIILYFIFKSTYSVFPVCQAVFEAFEI